MFNYYKMKLKGSGGGSHGTFSLNMWLGGGGTFYVFIYMLTTGTRFKGSSDHGGVVVASVFILYTLFFFSQHFKAPRFLLLFSSGLFSFISLVVLIYYVSSDVTRGIVLGSASIVFYGVAFNLTRISIDNGSFRR